MDALQKYHQVDYDTYFIEGYTSKVNYMRSIWQIRDMINRNNYDLIHIHYGLSGLFLLFNPKPSIPVLLTLHGGDIQKEQKKYMQVYLSKHIIRKSDFVVTLNKSMDTIVKRYNPRTQIVPCSVDTEFFCNTETKTKLNKENQISIIFPSDRNRSVKNYPLFEKTIEILRLQYHIKEIELVGLSRDDVKRYMQTSDLLLLTSFSEGSPQVVKEALSCNLPVVSTPVGDVELLLNGVCNCLVSKTFSPEELAKDVSLALSGQIKGITGREKIKELQLDEQTTAKKIYSIYSNLVSEHSLKYRK